MNIADESIHPSNHDDGFAPEYGLSKREYFAAMVLQGLASRPGSPEFEHESKQAVQYADALIKELEK